MKKYNSFKEIDQDLKIFRIEAEISKQKVNIDLAYIKQAFSFVSIVAEVVSYFGQKAIYAKIGTQLLRKFRL